MSGPLMACGHSAQGITDGQPVCAICWPSPDARRVADTPDLTGRMARCHYDKGRGEHRVGMQGCGYRAVPQPVPSSVSLPFFAYQPDKPEDSYYCGCWGWD